MAMMLSDQDRFRAKQLLDAAVGYVRRGWHVFPVYEIASGAACACPRSAECGHPGKHPRTPRGVLNATTDEKQIRSWWQRWPLANVAIATGPSGLVVVDVDPRNGGDESLGTLPTLPDTARALTGGGGEHHVFKRPEGVARVRGTPLAQGIDIKADGGYIVAAPSSHVSGRCYCWDAGARLDETALAVVPDWILAKLDTSARRDHYQTGGAVTEGFLGAAFDAMGWLGRSLGADKAAAKCPWEDEHSSGKRYDSSTVVFAPGRGQRVGWFWCSHEHCRHRTLTDVLAVLPPSAKRTARDRLGLDQTYDPNADQPPPLDVAQVQAQVDASSESWARALRRQQDGRLTRDPGNATLLLANLDEWRGCLEYDAFADRVVWARPCPDVPGLEPPRPGDELADHHVIYVGHWLAKFQGVSFTKTAVQDALEAAAKCNVRHPVRDWLNGLSWDGKTRLPTWLCRYLGAPQTDYVCAVGRWWAISAVARIYEPGCQADHLVVLEGPQGAGKSSAVRLLGGDWYLGRLPDLTNKDAVQVLQGHWIVEIGELDAFRGAASTRVKAWVTCTVDSYRPAYGRFSVRRPRQCVFLGTTNESHYLTDATGARRFWPVAVRSLDREALVRDREQLWAEARHYYEAGEEWWPQEHLADLITEEQEDRFAVDEWQTKIARWAQRHEPGFTVGDVLAGEFLLDPAKWDRPLQTRVGNCLRRLGFVPRQVREGRDRVRRYYPA